MPVVHVCGGGVRGVWVRDHSFESRESERPRVAVAGAEKAGWVRCAEHVQENLEAVMT